MLELDHIDYTIGDKQILNQVSLQVQGQTTLAILGASGSGKSTILRIILGLAAPDSGRVLIHGRDISRVPYDELVDIRKSFGMVFQDGALFDSMTVGENVGYYFMEHDKKTHAEVETRVLAMLTTVGLRHTIDMMPDELSGGMRRRVAIARALIYKPELILYDEPTTGLDPVSRANILTLIEKLKQDHRVASIIVTHNLDDAAKVADHFLVIRQGRVAWSGPKKAFMRQHSTMIDRFFQ
jgi:phospholipid/cholesterol/gamma-HCH transport system ATP-binding protein